MAGVLARYLARCWRRLIAGAEKPVQGPPEIVRARQFIAAIDAGGIPLDARHIVRIAQDLGLEVARREPHQVTIQRIRAALGRAAGGAA